MSDEIKIETVHCGHLTKGKAPAGKTRVLCERCFIRALLNVAVFAAIFTAAVIQLLRFLKGV